MKPGALGPHSRLGVPGAWVAIAISVSAWLPLSARAADSGGRQARGPYIALAGGAWTIDLIGLTDGQPRPHGHAGGEAEVGWVWGEAWATSTSFRWGGTWFDFDAFSSVPYGHLREETWMLRFIVDRTFSGVRERSVWLGAGFLYGEAHTDVTTSMGAVNQPPNFYCGGLVRAGAGFHLGGPFELYGELEQAVFRARGGDPDFQEAYRWLGRSLAGHIGLRLALQSPHAD